MNATQLSTEVHQSHQAAEWRRLAELHSRNGCFRVPSARNLDERPWTYKKGWEVRIVVDDQDALGEVQALLERVGLRPGTPYAKHQKIVQPVYGRGAVLAFREWRDEIES